MAEKKETAREWAVRTRAEGLDVLLQEPAADEFILLFRFPDWETNAPPDERAPD